jgi:DNA-binding response OmpR family regulator
VAIVRRNGTILVVEDDGALRTFYRSALMMAGYRVVTAENGIEALRRIDTHGPDAIVLDLGLPILSGHDVYTELSAHPNLLNIPLVIVTGADTTHLIPRNACIVLKKPIRPDQLIDAIEACLHKD